MRKKFNQKKVGDRLDSQLTVVYNVAVFYVTKHFPRFNSVLFQI